jgi:hypothetical protein
LKVLAEAGLIGDPRSLVGCGGISMRRMNEFVTADALFVLKKAGRLL